MLPMDDVDLTNEDLVVQFEGFAWLKSNSYIG